MAAPPSFPQPPACPPIIDALRVGKPSVLRVLSAPGVVKWWGDLRGACCVFVNLFVLGCVAKRAGPASACKRQALGCVAVVDQFTWLVCVHALESRRLGWWS